MSGPVTPGAVSKAPPKKSAVALFKVPGIDVQAPVIAAGKITVGVQTASFAGGAWLATFAAAVQAVAGFTTLISMVPVVVAIKLPTLIK